MKQFRSSDSETLIQIQIQVRWARELLVIKNWGRQAAAAARAAINDDG